MTYRLIPWIKAKTTNEQQIYLRAIIKDEAHLREIFEEVFNEETAS